MFFLAVGVGYFPLLTCVFPTSKCYRSSSTLRQGEESNRRTGSRNRVVEAAQYLGGGGGGGFQVLQTAVIGQTTLKFQKWLEILLAGACFLRLHSAIITSVLTGR